MSRYAVPLSILLIAGTLSSCEARTSWDASDSLGCEQLMPAPRTDLNLPQVASMSNADAAMHIRDQCPEPVAAELILGVLELERGNVAEAIDHLSAAESQDARWEPRRMLALYVAYAHVENESGQAGMVERARRIFPDSLESRLLLARSSCKQALEDCTSFIPDLERIFDQLQSELALRTVLIAYASAGRNDEALRVLDSGLVDWATVIDVEFYTAIYTYVEAGRIDDAEHLYRERRLSRPTEDSEAIRHVQKILRDSGLTDI